MMLKAVTGIVLTVLLVGVLTLAIKVQPVAAVDWWPMFRHDLSHTGYSTSTAPNTNNTRWKYKTEGQVWSSPAVANGRVFIGSPGGFPPLVNGFVYCFGPERAPDDKFGQLAPYIVLASAILVAAVAITIYVRRRKKRQ